MKRIQTVRGNISPEELGFCHSHEHILLVKCKSFEVNPALCMDDYEKSLEELRLFRSVGGGAMVDAQPVGAGRMSVEQARLSEESGVHIVASTGFHKMDFYDEDHWIFSRDEAFMEALFVHELTVGMYTGTEYAPPAAFHQAKAGNIKVAFDTPGLNPQYKKLFTAAAKAQIKTGAPFTIHVEGGTNPLILDDFLTEQGMAPEKRIYCHLDRAVSDMNIHLALAQRGAYIEYDTICRLKYHDDAAEIALIKQILAAGYEDQLLLGLDATNKRLKAYGGEIGLDYIKAHFIPQMEAEGISSRQIHKFMVTNPAKAFSY